MSEETRKKTGRPIHDPEGRPVVRVALVLPQRLADRLKRVKRGDRSRLIVELLDQHFRTIDGQ